MILKVMVALATLTSTVISVGSAYATDLTVPHTFSPGTTVKSSEINENFSTIYNAVSALPGQTGGLTCITKEADNLVPDNFPNRQITLFCDPGYTMISGGASCYNYGNWYSRLTDSSPNQNGWQATCIRYDYNGQTPNEGAQVVGRMFVRCCK